MPSVAMLTESSHVAIRYFSPSSSKQAFLKAFFGTSPPTYSMGRKTGLWSNNMGEMPLLLEIHHVHGHIEGSTPV